MAHGFSAGAPTADRNPDQQMGGLSRKTKNRTGGPVWETGGGGACLSGAQQFQKKLQNFLASLRGRVDHLIAVVERVEIAKGINLDVSSLRERLQGQGLAGGLGARMSHLRINAQR